MGFAKNTTNFSFLHHCVTGFFYKYQKFFVFSFMRYWVLLKKRVIFRFSKVGGWVFIKILNTQLRVVKKKKYKGLFSTIEPSVGTDCTALMALGGFQKPNQWFLVSFCKL